MNKVLSILLVFLTNSCVAMGGAGCGVVESANIKVVQTLAHNVGVGSIPPSLLSSAGIRIEALYDVLQTVIIASWEDRTRGEWHIPCVKEGSEAEIVTYLAIHKEKFGSNEPLFLGYTREVLFAAGVNPDSQEELPKLLFDDFSFVGLLNEVQKTGSGDLSMLSSKAMILLCGLITHCARLLLEGEGYAAFKALEAEGVLLQMYYFAGVRLSREASGASGAAGK